VLPYFQFLAVSFELDTGRWCFRRWFSGLNILIKAWLSRRGRRGAADADWTFTCDDVAGQGKSAAADGGSCNVGLVLLPKGFALAEEKVVTKLIAVKSPS
jgi:hypothetical protein